MRCGGVGFWFGLVWFGLVWFWCLVWFVLGFVLFLFGPVWFLVASFRFVSFISCWLAGASKHERLTTPAVPSAAATFFVCYRSSRFVGFLPFPSFPYQLTKNKNKNKLFAVSFSCILCFQMFSIIFLCNFQNFCLLFLSPFFLCLNLQGFATFFKFYFPPFLLPPCCVYCLLVVFVTRSCACNYV